MNKIPLELSRDLLERIETLEDNNDRNRARYALSRELNKEIYSYIKHSKTGLSPIFVMSDEDFDVFEEDGYLKRCLDYISYKTSRVYVLQRDGHIDNNPVEIEITVKGEGKDLSVRVSDCYFRFKIKNEDFED